MINGIILTHPVFQSIRKYFPPKWEGNPKKGDKYVYMCLKELVMAEQLNWINLDRARGLGICFYFQFLMFAPNAGAVLEMKYDLRIMFASSDSELVVV